MAQSLVYSPQRYYKIELDRYVENKIHKMSIKDAFTEYLDAASGSKGGYKYLPKTLFTDLCEKVKRPEDIDDMKDVLADFVFHHNKVSNRILDDFMKQGLKIDPLKMLDFFEYH